MRLGFPPTGPPVAVPFEVPVPESVSRIEPESLRPVRCDGIADMLPDGRAAGEPVLSVLRACANAIGPEINKATVAKVSDLEKRISQLL